MKLHTWDAALRDTLIASGAQPLITSYLVTVDSGDPAVARWRSGLTAGATTERDVEDPVVAAAAWCLYQRTHAWDPVAPATGPPAGWLDDVVAAATIDGAGGLPVAVVCAHQGHPAQAAHVGAVEAAADEAEFTSRLVAWLLGRCGRVEIEADDGIGAHPVLVAVLRSIPGAEWGPPLAFLQLAGGDG